MRFTLARSNRPSGGCLPRPPTSPARRAPGGVPPDPRTWPFRPGPRRLRRASARPHPTRSPPRRRRRSADRAWAWRTSCTARTAIGWIARPDSPPPPAPSAGRRVDGSTTIPSIVLTSVTASAPAACTASATSTMRSVFGLSFAQRGRPQPSVAAITAADISLSWAKIPPRPSRLGHDRLTSTATTPSGAAAEQVGGAPVLVDRAPPDARHDGRAAIEQARQVVGQPVRDAGALQPDRVQHPLRCRVQAGRGIPGPLEGGERLDDDRADRREVEERRQLVGVAGGSRGRHHRVAQLDRADLHPRVDAHRRVIHRHQPSLIERGTPGATERRACRRAARRGPGPPPARRRSW